MSNSLFRTKKIDKILADAAAGEAIAHVDGHGLSRVLTLRDLTFFLALQLLLVLEVLAALGKPVTTVGRA